MSKTIGMNMKYHLKYWNGYDKMLVNIRTIVLRRSRVLKELKNTWLAVRPMSDVVFA